MLNRRQLQVSLVVLYVLASCARTAVCQEAKPPDAMQTFDPAHQRPLAYSDKSIDVRLIVGKEAHALQLTRRDNGKQARLELPAEMAQVDEIKKATSERLVVRGMANGSVAEIIVVDLATFGVSDRFMCYLPVISPDGRDIAFIKFYPSHFAEGVESHYMLYDLTKNAVENRPAGVSVTDWERVGICVYPSGIGNSDYDNMRRPPGTAHQSRSSFFWSADSRFVVFADQIESASDLTVVEVEVTPEGRPLVKTLEQPTEQLCPPSRPGEESCAILMRDLKFRFEKAPEVLVTFELVASRETRSVAYELTSFR